VEDENGHLIPGGTTSGRVSLYATGVTPFLSSQNKICISICPMDPTHIALPFHKGLLGKAGLKTDDA
jgi:hypothetical protein